MSSHTQDALIWHKSSYSGGSGACVETAFPNAASTAVRDSKDPEGPHLRFTPAAWDTFVSAVVAGEFGDI